MESTGEYSPLAAEVKKKSKRGARWEDQKYKDLLELLRDNEQERVFLSLHLTFLAKLTIMHHVLIKKLY